MLIEVDTGVFYNTETEWYQQSEDCIAMGESLMQETPQSISFEQCLFLSIISFEAGAESTTIVLPNEYTSSPMSVGDDCTIDGVKYEIESILGSEIIVAAVLLSALKFSMLERMLTGTWQTTTATGTFDMTVVRHYEYPATSKAFLAKEKHDTVTVNQLS